MLKELFSGQNSVESCSGETIDILRLIRSENVGPRTFTALIKLFGNASNALENIETFSLRGGRSKPIKVFSENDVSKELELLAKNKAKLIHYKSPKYSRLLLEIGDFPPILTYKGNIDLLHEKTIAIVGARNASVHGKSFASKLARQLAEHGFNIVSGLARGIDTAAHHVVPSQTIAVLAGGIDYIYPPENAKLYDQIASEGLIIAELPTGSKPLGQNFPQRNRLIAGLALATLVIEASLKSGSLITARYALEYYREVFAVPGFPLDPRCQGTNKLIKDGAYLVESIDDIISNLPSYEKIKKSLEDSESNGNNFKSLNSKYINQVDDRMRQQIFQLLSSTPVTIDSLIGESNLPLPVIYTIILELELAGQVIRYPGNKVALIYK